ncbi:hypothetical protein T492DRAFT_834070 [Pavlovales sp. CCMP2436]|nr:hypothetical protein T492DRAFT_834070 [Pavlovales sp. CCMP2436]
MWSTPLWPSPHTLKTTYHSTSTTAITTGAALAAASSAAAATPAGSSETGEALATKGEARLQGSASGRGRVDLAGAVKAEAELASIAMTSARRIMPSEERVRGRVARPSVDQWAAGVWRSCLRFKSQVDQ